MADMHEVVFKWPQTGPNSVIVTGTFDKWSSTRKLTKTATGFVGTAKIPWDEKILYKYIVDGNWALVYGSPVEVESRTGFVNHVYIAPPKPPVALPTSEPESVIADATSEPVGIITEPEDVDKNHSLLPTTTSPGTSQAIAVAYPVTKVTLNEPAESSVSPIALVNDAHAKCGEPLHAEVGEASMADAKSESGTTAVADPEVTADIINTPVHLSPNHDEPEAAEKKMKSKPAALPSTPTKGEVFPSVSPPSSPLLFNSLRGSGKKKRTPSFLARLKHIFKSDKEKDKSAKEKAETKT